MSDEASRPVLLSHPALTAERERWGRGSDDPGEQSFLSGPQPRIVELWRAFRIFTSIIRGFRALHFVGPCVTFFGSARFKEDHPYYEDTRELARRIGLQRMGEAIVRLGYGNQQIGSDVTTFWLRGPQRWRARGWTVAIALLCGLITEAVEGLKVKA